MSPDKPKAPLSLRKLPDEDKAREPMAPTNASWAAQVHGATALLVAGGREHPYSLEYQDRRPGQIKARVEKRAH